MWKHGHSSTYADRKDKLSSHRRLAVGEADPPGAALKLVRLDTLPAWVRREVQCAHVILVVLCDELCANILRVGLREGQVRQPAEEPRCVQSRRVIPLRPGIPDGGFLVDYDVVDVERFEIRRDGQAGVSAREEACQRGLWRSLTSWSA